jgi:hypothetical protein
MMVRNSQEVYVLNRFLSQNKFLGANLRLHKDGSYPRGVGHGVMSEAFGLELAMSAINF